MKVLLISHTVFSKTNNMGKTLLNYFSDYSPDEIAQLYIHSEIPTNSEVCTSYYRFSDADALKSILNPKRKGTNFTEKDIDESRMIARTDAGVVKSAYVLGSKRKAWSMVAREMVWKLSRWKNHELLRWIDEVKPDIVVLASGDYGFMYDIAYEIAEYCSKPLVTMCFDDFYFYNRNNGSVLGKLHNRMFMKSVKRTMERSDFIFTLSDKMNRAYQDLFHKPCYTVHNTAPKIEIPLNADSRQISYIGNLGFGRLYQLVEIGKTVSELRLPNGPDALDVYTGTFMQDFLDTLEKAEGVELHGRIDADEVLRVLGDSMAVIHTESFSPEMRELVRFSVSTKIAESLMYGPCLIAYGPEDIASIEYLKENNAAFVITRPEDLASGMREILTNQALREEIVANARRLAAKNHDTAMMSKKVRSWLQEAIDSSK